MNDAARKKRASATQSVARPGRFKQLLLGVESWLFSLVMHAIVLVLLGLWTLPVLSRPLESLLDIFPTNTERVELDERQLVAIELNLKETIESNEPIALEVDTETLLSEENPADFSSADELEAVRSSWQLEEFGNQLSLLADPSESLGGLGPGMAGRAPRIRASLLHRKGGNMASEKAVRESLNWLARHQLPDGSWNFDHRFSACQGRCSDPGETTTAVRAATGLALLPFLGAGQIHTLPGPYREVVQRGALALVRLMQPTGQGGSFHEPGGNMYSHGIASMALCEAFAMTGDPALARPAQLAINFICHAQDPLGGGWRYEPHQPGDTSVMGWQIMALKSGHMASLSVPSLVIQKASRFLDGKQVDGGEGYCYLGDKQCDYMPTTSAIGLLCRMYLGWPHDHPALRRGALRLARQGPSTNQAYFNYYATQVLFQYTSGEGELWKKWNTSLRDMLIASQATAGHEQGSWSFDHEGSHSKNGGRLYCTAMASMTLEVYYRYLPIYKAESVESDFETNPRADLRGQEAADK
jgi:hypothetical protein